MIRLLDKEDLPQGFRYPAAMEKLLECQLTNFDVWYFMDEESARSRIAGLQERYPERKLVPFSRRGDCDDVACFEAGKGGQVFVIHDFASAGYEQREQYESLWDWLKAVIGTMIEWEILEGIQ